ncbi:MAG: hypothetical protein AAGA68_20615 [Pseudomonadota bacterium]
MSTLSEIEIVIAAITAIDRWHGVSADDRPTLETHLRSDLDLDLVRVAELSCALRVRMPSLPAECITEVLNRSYREDATLGELAGALEAQSHVFAWRDEARR